MFYYSKIIKKQKMKKEFRNDNLFSLKFLKFFKNLKLPKQLILAFIVIP